MAQISIRTASAMDEDRAAALIFENAQQFRYLLGSGGFEAVKRDVHILHPEFGHDPGLF